MKILEPLADRVYALMRILTGLFFAFHGVQKVFGILTEKQPALFTQVWLAGWIELVCGLMIAVGLGTRHAAFLSSGTMAVAYFQFHWKFAFDQNFFPAVNKGELAAVYAWLFLYFACRGTVCWGLDVKDAGPG